MRSLRFAILNTEAALQEWQARCVTDLLTLGNIQIVLSIMIDRNRQPEKSFETTGNYFNELCFKLYSNYFVRPSATRLIDMNAVIMGIPLMRFQVTTSGPSFCLRNEDIQAISTYDLDVILCFGSGMIGGQILNIPRFGVWSFSHTDQGKPTAGLPCFWEMYNGDDSVGMMLSRLNHHSNSKSVLKKGVFGIKAYSYAENVDELLFETARWPSRVCIEILNGVGEYVSNAPSPMKPAATCVPNIFQMLRLSAKILRNRFMRIYKSLFHYQQWNIGIAYAPIHAFLASKPPIHYFPLPKKGTFLADPFGVLKDNKVTILCENFTYDSPKGVICSIEVSDHARPGHPVSALDLPVHVSYPYLIEYDRKIYCVPETAAAREVGLYKAEHFPDKWRKVATLINNVAAIDPTLFRYDGRWWLMYTDKEQNAFLNLFAWYAQNLFGPWKPHAANPIKTDIHSARSAGTPFEYEGVLYRPAQDCSRTYGGRIVINRAVQLTPKDFMEEQVATIEPTADSPFPDGLHTISSVGNITLLDGKRIVFIGTAFKQKLRRRFSKMLTFNLMRERFMEDQ